MPRFKTTYICQQCEFQSPQWMGKCPNCGAWNSFLENVELAKSSAAKKAQPLLNLDSSQIQPVALSSVQKQELKRLPTTLNEFDQVLGGGIVPGSVTLIGGEPGIGKSTILLQIAMIMAKQGIKVYYISGEESPQQIKLRADRIGSVSENLIIYAQTDIDQVLNFLNNEAGKNKETNHSSLSTNHLVIIDSIQTVSTTDIESAQGTVSQVKEVTARIVRYAKSTQTPIFVVGHITKDGTLAGPKVLEHLVDAVIYIEGERYHDLRLMRAAKNRFGSSDEIGVFQMTEQGLHEVANPSGIFLEERTSAPGAVAFAALEGSRPVILEVQALVTQSFLAIPRRTASGFDINRLQMLIAVLSKRLNLQLYNQDIFVNIVGGLKINEPAADLAVCIAIISSFNNLTIPQTTIAFGEVGLQGEVRRVTKQEKRIEESKKLGFDAFLYPENVKNILQISQQLKKN